MTRFDLISPRARKDGKTHWQKVGAAFPREQGGFSLVFDALPLPDAEGQVRLLMSEAKPREGNGGGSSSGGYGSGSQSSGGGSYGGGGGYGSGMDDHVPFAAQVL